MFLRETRNAYSWGVKVAKAFSLSILLLTLPWECSGAAAAARVALVIGNSKYEQLGNLSNTPRDARAINQVLREMGFSTRLIIDASEQRLRRELRNFSEESEKADLALVFYAGHGAQVLGENYLLPTDMDVPKRESDIQLSAIKVDDVVSSIRSPTKVIFLDACRDNPALVKSLSKGRGSSYAGGLAPAKSISAERGSGTGGIFVAYATDAGSIALDGGGEHSPFTEALLHHLKKPISIDDMFSLVTREVRLSTRNAQRPYKYASLESIICLPQSCPAASRNQASPLNSVAELQSSEDSDYELATKAQEAGALAAFVEKYPSSPRTNEAKSLLRRMLLKPFDRWVFIDRTAEGGSDLYIQPSSFEQGIERVWVNSKSVKRNNNDKSFPSDVSTAYATSVYDCKRRVWGGSQISTFGPNNERKSTFVSGPPELIDLSLEIAKGSIAEQVQRLLCTNDWILPIVPSDKLNSKEWSLVVSVPDGGVGYIFQQPFSKDSNEKSFIMKTIYDQDKKEGYLPPYTIHVQRMKMNCATGKWKVDLWEYYDSQGHMVAKNSAADTVAWWDTAENTPAVMVRRVVCGR